MAYASRQAIRRHIIPQEKGKLRKGTTISPVFESPDAKQT